jgi:predicted amidohydrolase YtcJ
MRMNMRVFRVAPMLAVDLILCASVAGAQVDLRVPDVIFVNGKIVTVNQDFDLVEALAAKEGKITAVGTSEQIRRLASAVTQVVDLGGKTVLPGFNDNHIHMSTSASGRPEEENWKQIESLEGLATALRERAEKIPTSEWIVASLTRPYFPNDIAPDRHWLDQRVPNHPVALTRGHLMMLNSRGLQQAGISRSSPDPEGGWIIRDEIGEPTGHLFEDPAKKLVRRHLPGRPALNDEEILLSLRRRLQELTRLGYTSFNVPGLRPWELRYMQQAYERWGEELPRVTIQLRLYPGHEEHDDLDEGVKEAIRQLEGLGFHTGFGNDRIKIGAVKMSVDGGLSAPTFWAKVPYDNTTGWRKGKPEFYGVVRIPEEALYKVSKRAHELGWQLGIHTIGDAAVEMAVNVIERVLRESPREDPRPYLHHVSVMPPEETLRKMADLNIIVSSQPAFVYWLGPFAVEALEGEREQTNNPQKSLLKSGIRLSYGTDGAPTDPRVEIWSAVMRKGWDGKVYGPGERVSLEEAIRAITTGTAYMNFDEKKKGSLEVGKFADMVVLGEDILTMDPDGIKEIPVQMTIIGGKIVHSTE